MLGRLKTNYQLSELVCFGLLGSLQGTQSTVPFVFLVAIHTIKWLVHIINTCPWHISAISIQLTCRDKQSHGV